MISFVNAKVNLGLSIVARRPDGYHDLETVFYPVGKVYDPGSECDAFNDILEICPSGVDSDTFFFTGRKVECEPEKNLVTKASKLFREELKKWKPEIADMMPGGMAITLEKHLPDGAGLGGGSADASFTLRSLNSLCGKPFTIAELEVMALTLGADCPFFIRNTPCYACGVGEKLSPVELDLGGKYMVIVKPDVYVSTKEAFSGITPLPPRFDLRNLAELPLPEWRDVVVNDFEKTIFPLYPDLLEIKSDLYDGDAVYASMSGSGSSIFGIFDDFDKAAASRDAFLSTQSGVWLLNL